MTKRFEYTDIDGIIKEAEAFIASEFVTTATPNSPVMTGPSGVIDASLLPAVAQAKASKITINRTASEPILRGDIVRATTANHVGLADPTIDLDNALVLGVAQNDADVGDTVEVLLLGVMTDLLFGVFSPQSILFLDDAGGVTDVKPLAPAKKYLVIIGKALGGNDILVSISTPTAIGV